MAAAAISNLLSSSFLVNGLFPVMTGYISAKLH